MGLPPGFPRELAQLPPGVDEDLVLAWVEGGLGASRVRELEAAHPQLARVVLGMRRDRAGLGAMVLERAPAGLAERVAGVLEREALLGLERAGAETRPPAIEVVQPRRFPAWGARVALAAGVVLVVGGVGMLARIAWRSAGPGAPLGPMAISNEGGSGLAERNERAMSIAMAPAEPKDERAADVAAAREDSTATMALAMKSAAPGAPGSAGSVSAAIAPPAETYAASAADLAREGRLMVRVYSREASPMRRVSSTSSKAWRVVGEAPGSVAVALAGPTRTIPPPAPAGRADAPVLTGRDAARTGGVEVETRKESATALLPHPAPVAMTVEVTPDEAALAALAKSLEGSLKGEVEFEALPLGMSLEDLGLSSEPPADSLLWWTQPAETWTRRMIVPVVVERM